MVDSFVPSRDRQTLPEILWELAQRKPDQPLYTFLDTGKEVETRSCGELDLRARALGAALQQLGREGERALLLLPPGVEFVEAFLGSLYSGMVAVPAYPPRSSRGLGRLKATVADAKPGVVLSTAAIRARLDDGLLADLGLDPRAWIAVDDVPDQLAEQWHRPALGDESIAFLQYTSGSTSSPKGVVVTHGSLIHNETLIQRAFRQHQESVVVGWLPLHHDMGLIGNVLQPLFTGSRCVLMSPVGFLQRPLRWLEAISRYHGTTSGGPNFAYDLCVRKVKPEEREALDLSSWEVAFNGAEPVRAETLARFARYFAPCGFRADAFFPCYGLAEATLMVTGLRTADAAPALLDVDATALEAGRVAKPVKESGRAVSLVGSGRNPGEQRIVIVHPETHMECPPDRVGEIWVSGPSVANGYWGQPDVTAEVFGARLADTGEGPFLRTGDLGFLRDGELFVTGRRKDLLILRGRNHYPQDIEQTVERSHPALRPGCGAAFSLDVEGEERLVVVQEVDPRQGTPFATLSALVARAVADEHELQIHRLVLIGANRLLKTTSGKVQRQACRKAWLAGELEALWESPPAVQPEGATPEGSGPPLDALSALPAVEPRARLLQELRLAVAGILRVAPEGLEPGRPLAEAGLDSLRAIEIKGFLEERFGHSVQLGDLWQWGSLGWLAGRILEAGAGVSTSSRVEPAGEVAEHPLSFGQSSLWYLHRLSPESAAYNIAAAARIQGSVDAAALGRAFQALLDRHPALRSSFVEEQGRPRVRVQAGVEVGCAEEDVAGWSDLRLRERLLDEAHRPFDLARDPLLRVRLFRRADRDFLLLLVVHHIAVDFWSLATLAEELGALYPVFAAGGEASPLPPLSYFYSDYVRWQQAGLAGAAGERSWEYWRRRLSPDVPELQLPADRPRPRTQTFRGAAHPFDLSPDLRARLEEIGHREGGTLSMVLLSAFQALLLRHGAQEDLAIGTPTAGRTAGAFAGVVGYFVNPVVLRGDLSGDPTFGELVRRARQVVLEGLEHQDYPFALLTERLQPDRDAGRSALFQVLFVFQQARTGAEGLAGLALRRSGSRLELGGLTLESVDLPQRTALFDLTLTVAEIGGGLGLSLEYSTDRFDAATAARLADRLTVLVTGAVSAPRSRLSQLPLLGEAERHQLLAEWNEMGWPSPGEPRCLHERFAAQASRTPERTALVWGEERWSYRELAARVWELSGVLAGLGVGPEQPVGVLLERTPEMVTALLGILAAGGAYLPLDPAYPRERLALMVEDSGAELVLSQRGLAERVSSLPARTLFLDEPWPALKREVESAGAGSLAYLIYTSGSTGRPKGVAIEHRSASVLLDWAGATFSPVELSGVLASTSINFDLSVFELFAPLTTGGTVILASNALELPALAAAGEVTLVNTVPSALGALLLAGGLPPSVRTLNLAGEPLTGDLARRAYERSRVERVLNLYGPSEDTTYSTLYSVERGEPGEPGIGRPILGTRGYVLDRSLSLSPAPLGVWGELYLSGLGLSRGYWGRPELTAERYLPDPFSEQGGGRMYRTGDGVRQRGDGSLEYLGRLDHQVKIRGFRIELGEIEAALRSAPSVAESVVLARLDASGGLRLVAYVVAPEAEYAAEPLRAHLRRSLPEHMVPAAFVRLESMPRTPNGKVDRSALPEPGGLEAGASYTAPRTSEEELLARLWSELLGVERVGVHDNFFTLGGHSLLAVRLVSRLRESAGVELPLRSVLETPTVAGLAERLSGLRRTELSRIPRVSRRATLPLSFSQERLWFLWELDRGSAAYNMPGALRLRGRLSVPALEAAVGEVVVRHEVLRTTFRVEAGSPVQVIGEPSRMRLPVVDLSGLPGEAAQSEAALRSREEARRPFDLERGPVLRSLLLRRGAADHLLLLTLHHVAADGGSLGVLIREVGALYASAVTGRPADLPELPVQYADFAQWQRQWLRGAVLEEHLGFWKAHLAGVPAVLELPADRPRPRAQSGRGDQRSLVLEGELAAGLRELARRSGTSVFAVLLAAFQALLSRQTGREDLVVGTPVANRNRSEIEGLIGFFVNMLALRTDLSGDPRVSELLERMHGIVLEAQSHQELPFERLVDELHLERSLAHAPLVQVMLGHQISPWPSLSLPGLEVGQEEIGSGTEKLDLTLLLEESPSGLRGSCSYSTDLWDGVTVERLLRQYTSLLAGAVSAPRSRLSQLPLLGEAERHQLLAEWNEMGWPSPGEPRCLHERFAAQASRTPERTALVWGEARWSYRELAGRVGELSGVLAGLGVGPEQPVGVLLERTPEMVTALLGILGAGGAYLPLDSTYPVERLALMVEDAGAHLVLSQRGLAGLTSSLPARTLFLDEPWPALQREPESAGVGSLAYLIYTSGSTGRPKGVAIEHRSASVLLDWAGATFSPAELSGVLASTSINFDLSVFELFAPLTTGGTVILASNALELPALAAAGEVTLVNTVPSALGALLLAGGLPPSVRTLNLAGEPLPGELVRRAYERSRVERVLNLYGPSEDTTYSTLYSVKRGEPGEPGIGRPLLGTRGYVLDGSLSLLPLGVWGELYLSGLGLSRGYLGRAELTAERYLPDPFSEDCGGRMYRTGDVVRQRGDGSLEYLGRVDHQVKVRGFRIELGEIEAALRGASGVSESVVVARPDASGDLRLVAYVVAGEAVSAGSAAESLRARLRRSLPEHMVPAAFVRLESLPRNPNGKVDRSALPEPGELGEAGSYIAPRTPAEEMLAGLWSELLGVERVGVHDNFFSLGGHSLLAVRLVSRLRESAGVELPLRSVLETPTVAGLAARLPDLPGTELSRIPRVSRSTSLPLSFSQERLWFLWELDRGSAAYNMPGALSLRGRLSVPALEAALGEVVDRHEALRTTFRVEAGSPVQVIGKAADTRLPRLPVVDLSGLPEEMARSAAALRSREEARRPFDLERGPVLRSLLLRRGAADHLLLLTLHHVAADGGSLGVLIREVGALYASAVTGRPADLPALPVQYADFAQWQRRWLRGAVLEEHLGFWKARLAGVPAVLELPADRPRPRAQSGRGDQRNLVLEGELAAGLRELARRSGTSVFAVLLSAFQALLSRQTGREDLVVGTPVANRNRAEIEGLIGFFVNTLALRADLAGDPRLSELVERVHRGVLEAQSHQELPFERLVDELHLERSLAHAPLVQVMLGHQISPWPSLSLPDLEVSAETVGSGTEKLDLTLLFEESPAGLLGSCSYSTDLWDGVTVERLLRQYTSLLTGAVVAPGARLSELPLLGDAERHQLLVEWTEGGWSAPGASRCLHERFAEQASRTPERTALVWGKERWSYRELARRAAELSGVLAGLGVGPERLVGVLLERTPEMVMALLGVLGAGGAYLPLDPAYPRERLALMLEDSGAEWVLTQRGLADRLSSLPVRALCLDEPWPSLSLEPASAGAGSLAYLIYTSGSTGRPKGVAIEHRSASARLDWAGATFSAAELSGVLASTSISFDMSVFELFAPLAFGGGVALADDALALPGLAAAGEVTLINTVPSALAALVRAGAVPPSVRAVNLGGSRCAPSWWRVSTSCPALRRSATSTGRRRTPPTRRRRGYRGGWSASRRSAGPCRARGPTCSTRRSRRRPPGSRASSGSAAPGSPAATSGGRS